MVNEELLNELNRLASFGTPIVIDLSQCGSLIKAKFFQIVNIKGDCYAVINVISPKRIRYNRKIVDLTKLDSYSYNKSAGIYTGQEQTRKDSDSLYVGRDQTRVWNKGHIGYFKIFNTLLSEQTDEIRKLLDVDENWDGEWEDSDIIE